MFGEFSGLGRHQFDDVEQVVAIQHTIVVGIGSDDLVGRAKRGNTLVVGGSQQGIECAKALSIKRIERSREHYAASGQAVGKRVGSIAVSQRSPSAAVGTGFFQHYFGSGNGLALSRFTGSIGRSGRWAGPDVVLNDDVSGAIAAVSVLIQRPDFDFLNAEFRAIKRDRVAISREASASASLADADFELRRRGAVVVGFLEEIGVPKRDHAGLHDVDAQAIGTHDGRRLAVLGDEFVLAEGLVAAVVVGDPLDFVLAVGEAVSGRKFDLPTQRVALNGGLYGPSRRVAAAQKSLHAAVAIEVEEEAVHEHEVGFGAGICDAYAQRGGAFATVAVLGWVILGKVAESDWSGGAPDEGGCYGVQKLDDLGVLQEAMVVVIALGMGAYVAVAGVLDDGRRHPVGVVVAPPDDLPGAEYFAAGTAVGEKYLVFHRYSDVDAAIPLLDDFGPSGVCWCGTAVHGAVVGEFYGVVGLAEGGGGEDGLEGEGE